MAGGCPGTHWLLHPILDTEAITGTPGLSCQANGASSCFDAGRPHGRILEKNGI